MSTLPIEKLQLEMKNTLDVLKCIEVVSSSYKNGELRFLCRVTSGAYWLDVLRDYLVEEDRVKYPWYTFFGKKFFVHGGEVKFGWVIMIESTDLDAAVTGIRKSLLAIHNALSESKKPASFTVPLPGAAMMKDKFADRVKPTRDR